MTQISEEEFAAGFLGTSRSELEAMNDPQLAQWHAGWKPGTAHHILAEKEWQRRLSTRQLQEQFKLDARLAEAAEKSNKFTMRCVVAATLVGAFIGGAATVLGTLMQQASMQQEQPMKSPNGATQSVPVTPARPPSPPASK